MPIVPQPKPSAGIDLRLVRIASPCPADWNKMAGDDSVRHCAECDLNVYNFSAMAEREIQDLLAQSKGRICARFYRRADGTMLTQDCPRGLRALRRRVSRIAVAVATALLGVGTSIAFAKPQALQGDVESSRSHHDLTGMDVSVIDPQGAPVSGAKVSLRSKDSKKVHTGITDSNGMFRLVGLAAGKYELNVEAANFETYGKVVAIRQGKVIAPTVLLRISGLGGVIEVGVLVEDTVHVETEDSSLGQTLTGRQITDLPQR
jgi:hypothetical protein